MYGHQTTSVLCAKKQKQENEHRTKPHCKWFAQAFGRRKGVLHLNIIDTRNQICHELWMPNILKKKESLIFAPIQANTSKRWQVRGWVAIARNKQQLREEKKPWNIHGNVARLRLMELMKSSKFLQVIVCVQTQKRLVVATFRYATVVLEQIRLFFHFHVRFRFQSCCSPGFFAQIVCYIDFWLLLFWWFLLLLSCSYCFALLAPAPTLRASLFARVCGGCDMRRFWYHTHSHFESGDDIFSINWLRYNGVVVVVVVVVVMHMRNENEAKKKTSNKTEWEMPIWKLERNRKSTREHATRGKMWVFILCCGQFSADQFKQYFRYHTHTLAQCSNNAFSRRWQRNTHWIQIQNVKCCARFYGFTEIKIMQQSLG